MELVPPSPLCCLRFNPKSTDTLVGGCYNGLITCFDLRKPNAVTGSCDPLETSVVEKSHHDPVSDVFWISSKTGHQCASVSTDGKMMWWDTRKLGEPLESLVLCSDTKNGGITLGGSSLEYNSEAGPTKYLVGTEQGTIVSVNLRNRKMNNGVSVYDDGPGKHHGPVYSIQRNPTHNKFFMSIGDWTAKIWAEDLKTPIMTTKYHSNYLTGGCWSPTRVGVFYTITMDGTLNVWDFFHRQNEAAYTHKVGDGALSSIAVQGNAQAGGKLVAVGDAHGTISLLEVGNSLSELQKKEKVGISNIFERETRREKNLELRERELKRAKALEEEKDRKEQCEKEADADDEMETVLLEIEEKFKAFEVRDETN
jgi:dynein intermediate chain 2